MMTMHVSLKLVLTSALAVAAIRIAQHSIGVAHAGNAISAEGVSDYSFYRSQYGTSTSDTDLALEASGFFNGMLPAGSPWSNGVFWTDNNVYDVDFYDRTITGSPDDIDYGEFDSMSFPSAFAFVGAHGTCNDRTTITCTTSSQCPSGNQCASNPPSAYSSECINNSPRRFVTSSTVNKHGQYVYYGTGRVKWGEDAFSGNWAGAGTDGGDAVVFVVNSCGSKYPWIYDETQKAFAGAMLMHFTMPQSNMNFSGGYADTMTWSSRGSVLATYALANPNSSITGGWAANLDSAPFNDGGSCPDQTSTYTYGGGYGYGGCAANLSIAFGDSLAGATYVVNSLWWSQAADYHWKPHNNNNGAALMHCNYDCNTYGFIK